MAADLRAQIFELRAAGGTYRGIADQLGVSLGKVQRELRKSGNGATNGSAPQAAIEAGLDQLYEPLGLDPDIRQRQKAIALKRLTISEQRLELDQLEQTNRLALLKGARSGGGQDAQLSLYLMEQINQLRQELRQHPAGPEARGLIDQITDLQKLGNAIAAFAPPASPSGPADVEYRVALRRLDLEDQRLMREHENRLELERRRVGSENMRNEALAKFVEQFGPMLAQVAQKWVEDRSAPPPSHPMAAAALPASSEAAAAGPESAELIKGECPNCRTPLEISAGAAEKCPACGHALREQGGAIVAADARPSVVPQAVPSVTF